MALSRLGERSLELWDGSDTRDHAGRGVMAGTNVGLVALPWALALGNAGISLLKHTTPQFRGPDGSHCSENVTTCRLSEDATISYPLSIPTP